MAHARYAGVNGLMLGLMILVSSWPATGFGKSQALKITHRSPQGAVSNAGEVKEITVSFDQPMVALGTGPAAPAGALVAIQPAVPGTWQWRGTQTMVFTPSQPFDLATRYTVSLSPNLRALAGARLDKKTAWSFTTPRPVLMLTRPPHGTQWISQDRPIELVFNQPVDVARAKGIQILAQQGTGKPKPIRFQIRGIPIDTSWFNDYAYATFDGAEVSSYEGLFSQANEPRALVLKPMGKWPLGSWLTVVVPKGLLGAAGHLGLEREGRLALHTVNPFQLLGATVPPGYEPSDGFRLIFTNPVAEAELLRHCQISPEATLESAYSESYAEDATPERVPVRVLAQLKPETTYTVSVRQGLKDEFGRVLKKAGHFEIKTGSFHPRWRMPPGQGVLEATQRPQVPVYVLNWPRVHRRLALLDREGFMAACHGTDPSTFTLDDDWTHAGPRNQGQVLALDFKPLLGRRSHGLVLARIEGLPPLPEGDYQAGFVEQVKNGVTRRWQRSLFQITDLGLTGKFSQNNGLVWVTRLSDARPVPQAAIEVRDDRGAILFTGKTTAHGVCEFPGYASLKKRSPTQLDTRELPEGDVSSDMWSLPRLWVFAQSGEDQAVLASHWDTGISPNNFGLYYDSDPQPVPFSGFLFTERGLYRAGETVYLKGIFRERRQGAWALPGATPYTLSLTDARGEEMYRAPIKLSGLGSFDTPVRLPGNAPTGYYSFKVEGRAGQEVYAGFRVEAYEPAAFHVAVHAEPGDYRAGQQLPCTIQGNYLFGAPMAKDRLTWEFFVSPYDYVPPGQEGFSFASGAWWDEQPDRSFSLAKSETRLNEQGEARVSARLDLKKLRSSAQVLVSGLVQAADEQTISGQTQVLVHRGDYYVGLKQNQEFLTLPDKLRLECLAVTPQGQRLAGRVIRGKIIHREWVGVRKAGAHGRYEWITETRDKTVANFKLKSRLEPVVQEYQPTRPGFYYIELTSKDQRKNVLYTTGYFYATGPGQVAWESNRDDHVDLVSDRKQYRPGETAKILVKNPYDTATALVTVERESIITRHVQTLSGNAPVIEIPMRDEYLPNVFVGVVLVKGRLAKAPRPEDGTDLAKPSFKMGYLALDVDPSQQRLTVGVHTRQAGYAPQDKVQVMIDVTGAAGQAEKAEVTVAVVDKGVLNLLDEATPDPYGLFYTSQPLSVFSAETRAHVIGQRHYGEKGENRGGGGGGDNVFRKDFVTTPFFQGRVLTDAQGRAAVSFTLPDNLTTYKIMAVAHTVTQFGSGAGEITVSKPLLLLESLPRFLRLGDSFTGGVTAHNLTVTAQSVRVTAMARGVSLTGVADQTLTLAVNQAQAIRFPFTADRLGRAEFSFRASAPVGKDGLTLSLPVIWPSRFETAALYGQTVDEHTEAITLPAAAVPGAGQVEVYTASTALSGLEANLDYLFHYPYTCCEQRISRLLPAIAAEPLILDFDLATLRGKDMRAWVQQGLNELADYQRPDGGFGFWPDSQESSPFLTAYALLLQKKAQTANYTLPSQSAQRAIDYLQTEQKKPELNWPLSTGLRYTTLAYMQYALALWGQADQSRLNRLYDERASLPGYGLAMLLRAMHSAGSGEKNAAPMAELERMLQNQLVIEAETAHFEEPADSRGAWIFQSNERTTATVLTALLEVNPETPLAEKIVRWLMSQRQHGHWQTTQNNAAVFAALHDYYQRYEAEEPQFTAAVRLAQRRILEAEFFGRSLAVRRATVPVADFQSGVAVPVQFSKQGPGRLYYGLRLQTYPRDPAQAREQGITVQRRILTLKGEAAKRFTVGETYQVQLEITSPRERNWVAVNDPLPAGFEIIQTAFATTHPAMGRAAVQADRADAEQAGGRPSFNHTEAYDDKLLVFADELAAGDHRHTYWVKAATAGRFYWPGTWAEEMYSPSVFGRSADQTLQIDPASAAGGRRR